MVLKNSLLVVSDINKSVDFYKKVLGLRVIADFGENIKAVCKRFMDNGMTPEQVAERMDVPIKFVNACVR